MVILQMAKPPIPLMNTLERLSFALRSELPLCRSCATSCPNLARCSLRPGVGSLRSSRITNTSEYVNGTSARRHFSHTPTWRYKTVEEAKSRYRSGPFSYTSGLIFLGSGLGLILYFRYEKERLERKRVAEATKGVGRPKVGGKFELVDQDGKRFTDEYLKGKHALVYFGFTHCPDICPEELDKMAFMIDLVQEAFPGTLRPVFITCDPARDTPAVVKSYLSEFHPALIGLTGSWEQIKAVCKAYRVYFSTPQDVKPGQDYLVDHSIYFYLMDPEGDFVEAIGRQHSPQQAAKIIGDHVKDWKRGVKRD